MTCSKSIINAIKEGVKSRQVEHFNASSSYFYSIVNFDPALCSGPTPNVTFYSNIKSKVLIKVKEK